MKKRMLLVMPALLGLLLCLFSIHLSAQDLSVSGKVTDPSGSALEGVTVTVKNTTKATTTDGSGNFSLSGLRANDLLVFSYVGYTDQEIAVGGGGTKDVRLQLATGELEDVVVIGYGTDKKSDLTGSVTSLKAKDFNPGANISVEQSLQGRVAGVQVYQKSGEPGSSMSVKVRGVSSITGGNDPLYVIDGMPVNNLSPVGTPGIGGISNNPNPRNPLNSLNPDDIASIEILKDASATAIFGSRGSNGVVLITTKRGTQGKLKIGYNAYYGFQKVANSLDLLTGDQYKEILNAIIDDGGGVPSERVTNDVVNVDWQKELFRNAAVQSHDLSFSGGQNSTRFYASIGFFNQDGVMLNSGTQRYTARFNLENSIANKYAFGLSLNTSYIKDKFNSVGLGVNENGSGLYAAINYDPTYAVYNADGSYNRSPFMTTIDHPLALINGQYANGSSYRTFGNIYGEYFFIPGLSVRVRVGGDINLSQRNAWVDPSTLSGLQNGGIAQINTGNASYYMGEATLNYNKDFGTDHNIVGLAGITYDHYGSNSFGGQGSGFALPDLRYDAIGSGNSTLNQIGSGRASTKILSYLGRVKYSFKDKFLLTASIRADGSSRFGPNNRFAYFPSAALAWKMQEEDFISQFKSIDELKLRVSYGSVGNQNIANYLYFSTFAPGADPVFGGNRYNSIQPTRLPNPDLKWEGARQIDAGVDFAFYRRRLTGTIDYYYRRTDDLLLALPQPLSSGFNVKTQNIGDMMNRGIELTLAGEIIRSADLTWTLGGNISKLHNEVLNLGPLDEIISGGAGFISSAAITKPGESLGSYYGYKVIGVWQENDDFSSAAPGVKPGDLKFLDTDKNNVINANDRVILGKSLPDYTFGFNTMVEYKGISLSLFFEGQSGASLLNNAAVDSYFPISFRRNRLAEPYLNRWTPSKPSNTYPSFVNPTSQGQQTINSLTVEDASYLRFQSARLAYRVPFRSRAINSLELYATGQNLFTWTKYCGIDPAVNAIGDDILKIDYSTYPLTRTFLFGINVQF